MSLVEHCYGRRGVSRGARSMVGLASSRAALYNNPVSITRLGALRLTDPGAWRLAVVHAFDVSEPMPGGRTLTNAARHLGVSRSGLAKWLASDPALLEECRPRGRGWVKGHPRYG